MTTTVDRETRLDVADLLVRYADCIDRRQWDELGECFTDDCDADYGSIGHWHSASEVVDWMRQAHDGAGHTMHRITNQRVTSPADGLAARSYVDALVMFADNQSGTRAVGYYDDQLVRTDSGWRIAARHFTMVMLQLVPDGALLDLGAP